jgi:hypothetical protein
MPPRKPRIFLVGGREVPADHAELEYQRREKAIRSQLERSFTTILDTLGNLNVTHDQDRVNQQMRLFENCPDSYLSEKLASLLRDTHTHVDPWEKPVNLALLRMAAIRLGRVSDLDTTIAVSHARDPQQ